jgi:hypothetical protein
VSRLVRQALALCTLKSNCPPFPIADAKAGTIIVAELEVREVTLQMLFTAKAICALHLAFEVAKEILDRVCCLSVFTDVVAALIPAMVHGFVWPFFGSGSV